MRERLCVFRNNNFIYETDGAAHSIQLRSLLRYRRLSLCAGLREYRNPYDFTNAQRIMSSHSLHLRNCPNQWIFIYMQKIERDYCYSDSLIIIIRSLLLIVITCPKQLKNIIRYIIHSLFTPTKKCRK